MRLWAIGQVGELFVILEQDWEYLHDGSSQPIWVRSNRKYFTEYATARRYLAMAEGLANPTSDSVVGGTIKSELAVSLNIGEYFAKVSPAHEYLVRS